MGKLIELTEDILQLARDGIDDLIDLLGKTCLLYYPPKAMPCDNCSYDPVGKKSSNVWRTGGPMPFSAGTLCPLCNGVGKRFEEKFDEVKFLCQWNPRAWFIGANIRIPDGYLQIKGYITDLPRLRRAEYVLVQNPISGYTNFKYKLDSEPIDRGNIIQARYFVALLRRIAE